jgi:hypothetical protein
MPLVHWRPRTIYYGGPGAIMGPQGVTFPAIHTTAAWTLDGVGSVSGAAHVASRADASFQLDDVRLQGQAELITHATAAWTLGGITFQANVHLGLLPVTDAWSQAAAHLRTLNEESGAYWPILLVDFMAFGRTFATREVEGLDVEILIAELTQGGLGSITVDLDELTDAVRLSGAKLRLINETHIANSFAGVLENTMVRMRLGFVGLDIADFLTIYTGFVDRREADDADFSLTLVDSSIKQNVNISTPVGKQYFPGTPPSSQNKNIPVLLGVLIDAPTIPILSGPAVGELGAELGTSDTFLYVKQYDQPFPESGSITVDSEAITYGSRKLVNVFGKTLLQLSDLVRPSPVVHAMDAPVTRTNLNVTRFLVGYGVNVINQVNDASVKVDPSHYQVLILQADRPVTAVELDYAPADPDRITVDINAPNISQDNLVVNGDWEAGDASGWSPDTGTVAAVTTPVLEGAYAGAVTGLLNDFGDVIQELPTLQGELYDFGFFYRDVKAVSIVANAGFESLMTSWNVVKIFSALVESLVPGLAPPTEGGRCCVISYSASASLLQNGSFEETPGTNPNLAVQPWSYANGGTNYPSPGGASYFGLLGHKNAFGDRYMDGPTEAGRQYLFSMVYTNVQQASMVTNGDFALVSGASTTNLWGWIVEAYAEAQLSAGPGYIALTLSKIGGVSGNPFRADGTGYWYVHQDIETEVGETYSFSFECDTTLCRLSQALAPDEVAALQALFTRTAGGGAGYFWFNPLTPGNVQSFPFNVLISHSLDWKCVPEVNIAANNFALLRYNGGSGFNYDVMGSVIAPEGYPNYPATTMFVFFGFTFFNWQTYVDGYSETVTWSFYQDIATTAGAQYVLVFDYETLAIYDPVSGFTSTSDIQVALGTTAAPQSILGYTAMGQLYATTYGPAGVPVVANVFDVQHSEFLQHTSGQRYGFLIHDSGLVQGMIGTNRFTYAFTATSTTTRLSFILSGSWAVRNGNLLQGRLRIGRILVFEPELLAPVIINAANVQYAVGTPGNPQQYIALTAVGQSRSNVYNATGGTLSSTGGPQTVGPLSFVAASTTTRLTLLVSGTWTKLGNAFPVYRYGTSAILRNVQMHHAGDSYYSIAGLQIGTPSNPGAYLDTTLPINLSNWFGLASGVAAHWPTASQTFVSTDTTVRITVRSQQSTSTHIPTWFELVSLTLAEFVPHWNLLRVEHGTIARSAQLNAAWPQGNWGLLAAPENGSPYTMDYVVEIFQDVPTDIGQQYAFIFGFSSMVEWTEAQMLVNGAYVLVVRKLTFGRVAYKLGSPVIPDLVVPLTDVGISHGRRQGQPIGPGAAHIPPTLAEAQSGNLAGRDLTLAGQWTPGCLLIYTPYITFVAESTTTRVSFVFHGTLEPSDPSGTLGGPVLPQTIALDDARLLALTPDIVLPSLSYTVQSVGQPYVSQTQVFLQNPPSTGSGGVAVLNQFFLVQPSKYVQLNMPQQYHAELYQDFDTDVGQTYTFQFSYLTGRDNVTVWTKPVTRISNLTYSLGTPTNESLYVGPIVTGQSYLFTNGILQGGGQPTMVRSPAVTFVAQEAVTRVRFIATGKTEAQDGSPPPCYSDLRPYFPPHVVQIDAVDVIEGTGINQSSGEFLLGTTGVPGLFRHLHLAQAYQWTQVTGTFIAIDETTRLSLCSRYSFTEYPTYFDNIYVKAAFSFSHNVGGENPVDAILYIINNFLPDYTYDQDSFNRARLQLRQWKFGAFMTNPGNTETLLQRMAQQCKSLLLRDPYGRYSLTVLDSSRPVVFTFNRLNIVEQGEASLVITLAPQDSVYTSFTVYFGARTGGVSQPGDFTGSVHANHLETSDPNGSSLVQRCLIARTLYGKERHMDFFAEFIQDFGTACLLLEWLVQRFTVLSDIVTFAAWLDAVPLRVGQVVQIEYPTLPNNGTAVLAELVGWHFNPAVMQVELVARSLGPAPLPAPVAENFTIATGKNQVLEFSLLPYVTPAEGATLDLSTIDVNPQLFGRQATFEIPGSGVFTVNQSGQVTFTPEIDFVGDVSTLYTIQDNFGTPSNLAVVTVSVLPFFALAEASQKSLYDRPVATRRTVAVVSDRLRSQATSAASATSQPGGRRSQAINTAQAQQSLPGQATAEPEA